MSAAASPRGGLLAVEVTARCDRACAYCYNDWHADRAAAPADLPADELVALVRDALEASGAGHVQITGGEPLLREDLFDIIRGIQASGRGVSLVTDGARIDAAVARQLAALQVGPVQPTLLAAQRDLHDELKGAPSFAPTVHAINRLHAAGVPVSVSFVCTRRNHDRFGEVVDLCFALGVKVVAFSRLTLVGAALARAEELAPDADMIAGCMEVAERAIERLGMKIEVAISLPHCVVDRARVPRVRLGGCALATEAPGFTIDPAGNLRACSVSPRVLGSLREESWAAIVDRARRTYFVERCELPLRCRECASLDACRGGCRESAWALCGAGAGLDPLLATSAGG